MGYRSDVVLFISKNEYENMLLHIPIFYNKRKFFNLYIKEYEYPSLENFTKEITNTLIEGKDNGKIFKNHILLRWYNIKWYNNDFINYCGTSYIDMYIKDHILTCDFKFIRLGDDFDDIEILGNLCTDECNIFIKREIVIT